MTRRGERGVVTAVVVASLFVLVFALGIFYLIIQQNIRSQSASLRKQSAALSLTVAAQALDAMLLGQGSAAVGATSALADPFGAGVITAPPMDVIPATYGVSIAAGLTFDGGMIAAEIAAPKIDAGGRLIGYCSWDNVNAAASAGRLHGLTTEDLTAVGPGDGVEVSAQAPVYALIGAGPDGTIHSTCAEVAVGTVVSGDHVIVRRLGQLAPMVQLTQAVPAGMPGGTVVAVGRARQLELGALDPSSTQTPVVLPPSLRLFPPNCNAKSQTIGVVEAAAGAAVSLTVNTTTGQQTVAINPNDPVWSCQ